MVGIMAKNNKFEKIKSSNNPHSKIKLRSPDDKGNFAEIIFNTVREPLLVLDKELRVVKASRSFFDFFKVTSDETIGTLLYDLGNHQWNIPKLRDLLETILPEKTTFNNYEVEHEFPAIGKRTILLNARQIERAAGNEKIILLAIEDITKRKIKEESLGENRRITNEYIDILLNHAHAPIIVWNSLLIIIHINQAFEKLSGYSGAELINKKVDILFPKDKIESTLELIKNTLLDDERTDIIEIDILTKNKDLKTVLWNPANIFDNEGKNIVATIAQDITNRKRSEEALTILETRYRRLFESAKDGILILNANTGKIIDVNPFLIELLGYSKENLIEKAIWEIGFFKDIAANEDKFIELQQKEYVRYENLPLETAGGRKINVEFVSNVYIVNHHKVIQCNIRDITERKKAEMAQLANEIKYRSLFENSMDAILLTSPGGKIFTANQEACRMFGYSKDEFIKLGRAGVVDITDPQLSGLLSERALNGKVYGELIFIRKDGTHFLAEISSSIFKDFEGFERTSMIIRDITARKHAEELLRKSEDKYRSIFENVQDVYYEASMDGMILEISPSIEILSKGGYHRDDLIGKSIYDFYSIKDGRLALITLLHEQGNVTDYEVILKNRDGSHVQCSISAKMQFDAHNTPLKIIGIMRDITLRKKAEEALIENEAKYRNLFNNSEVGMFRTRLDGSEILEFNEKYLKILNYTREEVTGKFSVNM